MHNTSLSNEAVSAAQTVSTPTSVARPRADAFHKVGLSFGSAGAIVRLDKDDRIMFVCASWVRTRRGATDKVFYTTPESLVGDVGSRIRCETLTGQQQTKRFDLKLNYSSDLGNMLEGMTDGGSYAVLYMDRTGQTADFQTLMRRLDASWRTQRGTLQEVENLSAFLHEDFVQAANDFPSGWAILYAAASLFGGQDPAQLPSSPPALPEDLGEACEAERKFRSNQRRARAIPSDKLIEFKARLNPEQAKELDDLIAGRRTSLV